MHKEAFDKIYRRFMDGKLTKDRKIEEKRRQAEIEKEHEFQELEQSRKKVGTKKEVENYMKRMQRDIQERQLKAEQKRQQKCIDEERKLKTMFKPKTNVNKSELTYENRRTIDQNQDIRFNEEDFVTFEQNINFNEIEFDFTNLGKVRKVYELEENIKRLQQK